MTFNIIKINDNKSVDVSFDIDNKVQNISNLPVTSEEDLRVALQEYEEAYIEGLKLEGNIKE